METAKNKLPRIYLLSCPKALGKSFCCAVLSGAGQQQAEHRRINGNVESTFSPGFHFLNVFNPLAAAMKNLLQSVGSLRWQGRARVTAWRCRYCPKCWREGKVERQHGCWRPAGPGEMKMALRFHLFVELYCPVQGDRMLQPSSLQCDSPSPGSTSREENP